MRYRQPKGLSSFEALRDQWIRENPEHTEQELMQACVSIARRCGLALCANVLLEHINTLAPQHGATA